MEEVEVVNNLKDKKKIEWLFRTVRLCQDGNKLSDLCALRGYKKISIYGWNEIGNCLLYELESSDLKFMYVIERNEKNKGNGYPIYTIEESFEMENPDAIIVCVVHNCDSIVNDLKNKYKCDVISFEDLIYEI